MKLNAVSSLALACVFAVSTGTALSQNVPPGNLQNVAQISASGTVEVQQDWLSLSLTTARDGVDASVVENQLKQALDEALAIARVSALPGQMDVRTGSFGLYPRYGKEGKISGWQGSTELILEGRDFSHITSTAGKIQSLTLGSVNFGLSREQRSKVQSEAQALAIERFKAKALEVSRAFGFSGYALREVAVNSNDMDNLPRPRVMSMAKAETSAATVPVEAGKSTVQVTVSGAVQMQ